MAVILTRVLGIPVATRETEGPSENIRLIEAGQAQLGFVTTGAALQAWSGTGGWTGGRQFRAMRAIFPMYDTPFHFVARRDSPITMLADLSGQRLGVLPEGGTGADYVPRLPVGLYNIAVAHRDLPPDLVYEIVRAVFDSHAALMEAHQTAAATVPANFVHNTVLSWHPGALRYYGTARCAVSCRRTDLHSARGPCSAAQAQDPNRTSQERGRLI